MAKPVAPPNPIRWPVHARRFGYTMVGWSVDPRDWRMGASADSIEQIIMRDAEPGRIVIMHDGSIHREPTITALRHVLPALEAKGYQIVSVGELLQRSDYATLRELAPKPCSKKAKTVHKAKPAAPRSWIERLRPFGQKPSGSKAS